MVVPPLYEFNPPNIVVPGPIWNSWPEPLMELLTVTASERSKAKIPVFMMLPVPRLPLVAPEPICKIAFIVVLYWPTPEVIDATVLDSVVDP